MADDDDDDNNNNNLFIYVLTQQPEGQLENRHEKRRKRTSTYAQT
jgi:hypothetical protein